MIIYNISHYIYKKNADSRLYFNVQAMDGVTRLYIYNKQIFALE